MRNPNNRPIDDLVAECCADLLSSYRLDASTRSRDDFPAVEALALFGVMGFGGKQMRGSLVLAATREPLEVTNPGGVTSQRDWICELANQLLGRVKNRLLASGVEIMLAIPAGLTGDNLCFIPSKLRAPQVFAAAKGYVCVWIDCEFAEGFELPASILDAAGTAAPEGETILF